METHARRRIRFVLAAALASALWSPGPCAAADELLTGDRLHLTKRILGMRSRDPSITLGQGAGSADDPVLHGGAARVLSIAGDVFDTTYPLPASGWRYLRRDGAVTGYVFDGPSPLRGVHVKAGREISVLGRGDALGQTLGGNPAPVRVVLTLGEHQYCVSFGGTVAFTPERAYLAKGSPAPDICPLPYGDDTFWLCRPGMANNQCLVPNTLDATVIHPDLSTTLEPEAGTEDHPYDCFYVYPTVDLLGPVGNHLDVTDPAYVALTLDPLLSQAARLNGLCRIFAPHYRQITLGTFGTPNAAQYLDIAYRDVLDAWRLYLKYHNGGRNVVVMGHSQGTFMTTRLLQEEVDPSSALRSRLIVALMIGGSVVVPQGGTIGGTFQNIPLCQTAEQTGCVIAYRSYAAGFPPANGSNDMGGPTMDVACTNPAALGGTAPALFSATYFPTHTNQPLFNISPNPDIPTPFVEFPSFYAGQCVKDATNHSYLEISVDPAPGDQRQNPIPFDNPILSPAFLGTHILDYGWAMGDLVGLVGTKAAQMP
jgi:DUF3089 family protein